MSCPVWIAPLQVDSYIVNHPLKSKFAARVGLNYATTKLAAHIERSTLGGNVPVKRCLSGAYMSVCLRNVGYMVW